MKALILCAGEGTRLRPLTEDTPKPMVRIKNKPILEYNIRLCKKYGIEDIAINTSYLPKKIKEYFGDGSRLGVRLRYSYESELLGTAGALNNFSDFFKDTFVVIYGDNLTDIDLEKMVDYHKSKKGMATLALRKKPEDPSSGYVILDSHSQIQNFIEKPSNKERAYFKNQSSWENLGIYVLEPKILKHIPQGFSDFGRNIFPELIKGKEKIFGFDMSNYYFGEIGQVKRFLKVKEDIESGLVKLSFDKNKAIFLDRDGVINEIIYEVDGKIMSPAKLNQVRIIEGAKEGIKKFKDMGLEVLVISNQPGVALKYIDEKELKKINEYLKKELNIDEIYYCPHHPKITGECDCRKPKIGLVKKAEKDFNIDVENSYFVGDSLSDIQTGKNAKVKKTFRIGTVRSDILELQHKMEVFPDFTYSNLIEVAEKIGEIELA